MKNNWRVRWALRLFSSVFFAAISAWACAINDEALQASYSYQEDARVFAPDIAGLQTTVWQDRLALPLGMRKTHTGYWISGLQLQQTLISFHGSNVGERRLYRLALPIDYVHKPWGNSPTQIYGRLEPAHYSDERLWDRRASDLEYGLRLHHQHSNNLTWVLGLRSDRRLGQARTYPVFGLEWQQTRRLLHHWVFPDWHSEFQWRRSTQLFAHIRPEGGQWRYGKYNSHDTMHYINWAFGLGVTQKLKGPLAFKVEFGQNLYRKLIYNQGTTSINDSRYWMLTLESRLER